MKVIALIPGGYDKPEYICQVSHKEVEQFLNLYYGKKDALKVGEEIDLGKGYSFTEECKSALNKTEAFISANQKVIETIFSGIKIMAAYAEPVEDAKQ